ncbi:MAG: hypothetical protein WAW52_11470 [Methanothrix sp.]|jgi:hypothetical protein
MFDFKHNFPTLFSLTGAQERVSGPMDKLKKKKKKPEGKSNSQAHS